MNYLKISVLLMLLPLFLTQEACKKENEPSGGDGDSTQVKNTVFLSTYHDFGKVTAAYIDRFTIAEDGSLSVSKETDSIVGDLTGVYELMDNKGGNIAYFADKKNFADGKYHYLFYNIAGRNFTVLPEADAPAGFTAEAQKLCPRVSANGKVAYMQIFSNTSNDEVRGNIQVYDIAGGSAISLSDPGSFILSLPQVEGGDATNGTIDPEAQFEMSDDGENIYMCAYAYHLEGLNMIEDKSLLLRYHLPSQSYTLIDAPVYRFYGLSQDDQYLFYKQTSNFKYANTSTLELTIVTGNFNYDHFPVQRQARRGTKVVYNTSLGLFLKDMLAGTDVQLFEGYGISNPQFTKDGNAIYFFQDIGTEEKIIWQTKDLSAGTTYDTIAKVSLHHKIDLLYIQP